MMFSTNTSQKYTIFSVSLISHGNAFNERNRSSLTIATRWNLRRRGFINSCAHLCWRMSYVRELWHLSKPQSNRLSWVAGPCSTALISCLSISATDTIAKCLPAESEAINAIVACRNIYIHMYCIYCFRKWTRGAGVVYNTYVYLCTISSNAFHEITFAQAINQLRGASMWRCKLKNVNK